MTLAPLPAAGPQLLISVRSADEAVIASQGGAGVIDVKEPARGPLGAAEPGVVVDVLQAVGQVNPVTAAAGDLGETPLRGLTAFATASGAPLIKLGVGQPISAEVIAGFARVRAELPRATAVAPALYADAIDASSLDLPTLRRLSQAAASGWVVVDTRDKSSGGLLHAWSRDELTRFVHTARQAGLRIVLAGSLPLDSVGRVLAMQPDLIGLRGAVCRGGRRGILCPQLLNAAKQAFRTAPPRKNLTHFAESPYSVS